MIDLKWNPSQLGINYDPVPPQGEIEDSGFWEPELVSGDDALIQSMFIALRDNPLSRALFQAEPVEADQVALRLAKSLEISNPEVVPGSLSYRIEADRLSLTLALTNDQNQTITAYFEGLFDES